MRARKPMKTLLNSSTAFVLCFALFISFSADAAEPATSSAAGTAAGKKGEPTKHSLTFEDELIEGASAKPELFFLFQKKNFNYGKLIKLRENFVPEMRRSSDDIQRGRGSN